MRRGLCIALAFGLASFGLANEPQEKTVDQVAPIPPLGITIKPDDAKALAKSVGELAEEIKDLRKVLTKKPALLELLPDVQIYHNAVYYALKYDEFYAPREVAEAKKLLQQGFERARQLRDGQAPWNTATGLVVRGYQSRIDGSVQPYGLIVPASYKAGSAAHRLDLWWHGRGEKLSELSFVESRQRDPGQFQPANAFVLHPYGRYCNANHFAGEIDTFEAIEHARKYYPIDTNRIVARGFSMGGAACWGYAVHYPGLWVAAAPGAGFSESPAFLRMTEKDMLSLTPWQKKLLHWYDCTDWAINLYNCPTVAYSGEIDGQKQAADIMAVAMKKEGLNLTHIIGPNTKHIYHPEARAEVNRRIDSIVAKGRDSLPNRIRFTTYTLRYNAMRWLVVDGIKEHWERARVNADLLDDAGIRATTSNVTALTFTMAPGQCPFDPLKIPSVEIDGQKLAATPVQSDRSWVSQFRQTDGKWQLVKSASNDTLIKRHGLQGPIDDAFMSSFVMVKPTGKPMHEKVGKWIDSEMAHAVDHWRKQFRGELTPIDDSAIDDKTIASSNLILWGDPQSNKVLAKIADKLPIQWSKDAVNAGQKLDASHHVPVLIYPNPLNPKKYVVLNSGFTFREFDYLNNARQTPRLPDWAVLDTDTPRTSKQPATIVEAGFFGERWELGGKK